MKAKKVDLERLMYIEALLLVKNELKRSDLVTRFGIAERTATVLIKTYEEHCPGQMYIDWGLSRPKYLPSKTCKACLHESVKLAAQYLKLSDSLNKHLE